MKSKAPMAILTKSRAKYGKRLDARDYNALVNAKSIAEIASYLKSYTHYKEELSEIREAAVHRGNLEMLLKNKMFKDFALICRFEKSVGEHYFRFVLLKKEIDELLVFLRYFNSGKPQNYLFAMPDFFGKHSGVDFISLTACKNTNDVLNVINKTIYHDMLLPLANIETVSFDFTAAEAAFDNHLYNYSINFIKETFSGDTRRELISIMNLRAELENIRKIYRAKLFYGASPDMIRSLLNTRSFYFKKRHTDSALDAQTKDELLDIIKSTKYSVYMNEYSEIDDMAMRILFAYCRKKIKFSIFPAVVMACVMILFEIEIDNITNIIEGKRYGVSNSEIQKLLIL